MIYPKQDSIYLRGTIGFRAWGLGFGNENGLVVSELP